MDGYRIVGEIGRGSFATVFKATDGSGRAVAVKTINATKLNRKLAENLDMEIAILTAASHSHVVSLIDVFRTPAEISIVMEYCDLGDLSLFIRKKGVVPGVDPSLGSLAGPWGGLEEFTTRHLLAQIGIQRILTIASVVEFLRFHHIVHRDFKPQVRLFFNVIILSNEPLLTVKNIFLSHRPHFWLKNLR